MKKEKNIKDDGITLITTHINADFDAVGSLVAAQKIYPEAFVLFPELSEKSLKNFFVDTVSYLFNMTDAEKLATYKIKRLVLVDISHSNRMGKTKALLDKKDIEIILYDHHPEEQNDIKADNKIIRETGANVTILTQILKEKNIYVSAEEATIISLGLFEDTGSFNFSSTTPEDFIAAAWLREKGANLKVISDLIGKEMTVEQVTLLNDMLFSSVVYNINGIEITLTTVSREEYIEGFAYLVMKMARMENIGVIFGLARMGEKIYVTGRSNVSEVNAGEIISFIGGGGHHGAASAVIKNKTLAQAENELIDILYKNVKSLKFAKDLMSVPAISISPDKSCAEAAEIITRYNINALLVIEKKENDIIKPIGFISRQIIEKAVYHDLGNVPVSEYMTEDIITIETDSDLFEVQTKLIENKQRILPVLENGNLKGVITRTDLLDSLVQLSMKKDLKTNPFYHQVNAKVKNVTSLMKERLSEKILDMLVKIGESAEKQGVDSYVVGGFVRDMFLYRDNDDIDIVIEGDGISFAKTFAKDMKARAHPHEKFGTAVIVFEDGFKIDVASARLEYYKFPAALPEVMQSSIKLDLFRRDFTINTLAIKLSPNNFGTLIDFYSAKKDIKEKMIRILHNLSFVEDPTRVFRAIVFEQRFGFKIGKLTSHLIENAVKMDFFNRLSGKRVFNELKCVLEEKKPLSAIRRMNDYDLIKVIHPNIRFDKKMAELFASVTKVISWHDLLFLNEKYSKWALYFLAFIHKCSNEDIKEICDRFEMPSFYKTLFENDKTNAVKAFENLYFLIKSDSLTNAVLYKTLSSFKTELILYIMAIAQDERVKKAVSDYYTKLRNIKISTTGEDLKNMGFTPGPLFSEIMENLFKAKLNGIIKTKEDETAMIKSYRSHQSNQR